MNIVPITPNHYLLPLIIGIVMILVIVLERIKEQ